MNSSDIGAAIVLGPFILISWTWTFRIIYGTLRGRYDF